MHYWASPAEARLVAGQEVALVGAGNSAGQAVVYLASHAAKVWMIVRGAGLQASMSRYLIERIEGLANVEVVTGAQVSALEGADGMLSAVRWSGRDGAETRKAMRHLFLFIGAQPNTDWLEAAGMALDDKGFIRTGAELGPDARPLETSLPGVFAIGDVRSGSVKRVASAVGEGRPGGRHPARASGRQRSGSGLRRPGEPPALRSRPTLTSHRLGGTNPSPIVRRRPSEPPGVSGGAGSGHEWREPA